MAALTTTCSGVQRHSHSMGRPDPGPGTEGGRPEPGQGNRDSTRALALVRLTPTPSSAATSKTLWRRREQLPSSFRPRDSIWFYAAAYNSPYVLWLDDDTNDIADIQSEIMSYWHELPRRLSEAY